MTDPADLSPREEVILMLAEGDTVSTIAGRLGTTQQAVRAIGTAYGYPQQRTRLKAIAAGLRRGDRDDLAHAGALPGCPWTHPAEVPVALHPASCTCATCTPPAPEPPPEGQPQPAAAVTGCPLDCGGCTCHLGNSAPCAHCADNHDRIDAENDTAKEDDVPDEAEVIREHAAAALLEHADAVDLAVLEQTGQLLGVLGGPAPTLLAPEQAARAESLRVVVDQVREATVDEVLVLAHWVATGEVQRGEAR